MTMRAFSLVLTTCLLAGCGYTFGSRLPEGIDSLEVPVFGSTILLRGLEVELTEALTEELKLRTPVSLVSKGGDACLTGSVVDYEKVPVYVSAGEVLAGRVKVVVTFSLCRSGSEKPLREGSEQETQDFDTRIGVLEDSARRKAVREIARKIVQRLEDW